MDKTCIKCGKPDAYRCHYNGVRQHTYGKGRGIKCNDFLVAWFCHSCDQEFTEGSMQERWNGSKYERSEEFLHWIIMSHLRDLKEKI